MRAALLALNGLRFFRTPLDYCFWIIVDLDVHIATVAICGWSWKFFLSQKFPRKAASLVKLLSQHLKFIINGIYCRCFSTSFPKFFEQPFFRRNTDQQLVLLSPPSLSFFCHEVWWTFSRKVLIQLVCFFISNLKFWVDLKAV